MVIINNSLINWWWWIHNSVYFFFFCCVWVCGKWPWLGRGKVGGGTESVCCFFEFCSVMNLAGLGNNLVRLPTKKVRKPQSTNRSERLQFLLDRHERFDVFDVSSENLDVHPEFVVGRKLLTQNHDGGFVGQRRPRCL